MKDFSRLWTMMAVLGAGSLPAVSSARSQSAASVRNEFVRAMDQALGQKKNEEVFRQRLGQLAVPANSYPGYKASQDFGRFLEEKDDEKEDDNENENQNQYQNQNFAIDLSQYALKYIGCSNIKTWSDDLAAEDNSDTVLKTDRFVVLRLCPRDSCSNYNKYGCQDDFGDYLIPMETYLQTMAETFFTQYEEYCETCYECMNPNYKNDDGGNNQYYNYNGGNDDANYQNMNDDGANNGNRRLNDDGYYKRDDDAYNNGNKYADDAAADDYFDQAAYCEYYSVCANYQTACQDYSNLGFDMEDYFECGEFNIGGSSGYLGPHCADDGKTISLGIYDDESCNDYRADISEVSNYMAVDQNDLEAYYSDKCISCLASDGYVLETNDDDYNNNYSQICGAFYDDSAKCNKYMGNDGNYKSSNQEAQEETVCNFIENLLTKSYNEYGEIRLQEISWKTFIPTPSTIRKMQTWQKYALSISILGCVGLYFYATYLYRAIQKRRTTWYPRGRKGFSTGYPGEPISMDGRLHSGIIQGRSHSSGSHFGGNGVFS